MFLLNEILWFLPLVVYAGYRLVRLIKRRLFKYLFAALFIVLCLGFFLAESLSHSSAAGWTRPLLLAGYYTLPVILYIVIFVVLADLVIGLLWLLKIPPREVIRSPRFRAVRLGVYLIVPALVVLYGILNYNHLRVKTYSIDVPRKSSAVQRLRIVFASDFHLGDRTSSNFLPRFVEKVNAQKPDLVLIGGDVLEGDRRDQDLQEFEYQFRRLRSKYGVFGVPGNHEGHGGNPGDFFVRSGIRLLQDEVVRIDEALILAGRNDGHGRKREPMGELLKDAPRDLPLVVMDHRPTDLDQISRSGADIQVSGHTHVGQLFPVNFITQYRYELDWGYKKKRQTHVFVSSGIQLWGPPVRTVGASEILVIDVALRPAN
jgi:predicted MPP superfamily phosphohydrolase